MSLVQRLRRFSPLPSKIGSSMSDVQESSTLCGREKDDLTVHRAPCMSAETERGKERGQIPSAPRAGCQ